MQLRVDINGDCLLTLLDCGSVHNFSDTEAAARMGIILSEQGGLRVAVANSGRLNSACELHYTYPILYLMKENIKSPIGGRNFPAIL
jgi:hypothetical protein